MGGGGRTKSIVLGCVTLFYSIKECRNEKNKEVKSLFVNKFWNGQHVLQRLSEHGVRYVTVILLNPATSITQPSPCPVPKTPRGPLCKQDLRETLIPTARTILGPRETVCQLQCAASTNTSPSVLGAERALCPPPRVPIPSSSSPRVTWQLSVG